MKTYSSILKRTLWQNLKRWIDSKFLTLSGWDSFFTQTDIHHKIHTVSTTYTLHRCFFPHLSSRFHAHKLRIRNQHTHTQPLSWVQWNSTIAKKITCLTHLFKWFETVVVVRVRIDEFHTVFAQQYQQMNWNRKYERNDEKMKKKHTQSARTCALHLMLSTTKHRIEHQDGKWRRI